ncbi:MAG: homoserine dehydrogenase [Clostridia bacterium]|nr:homoserine dehydrogenase [Clostridia bacterium]
MIGVAVLGFGTVGSGVVDVIEKNRESFRQKAGEELYVKYVLDIRDFPGDPYENLIIHDFSVIENDPEVSIVVETIGGTKIAGDFTRRALNAGKSVVTSNKELVAASAVEFFRIAAEKNVNYLFEASVGGGIPIIRPLNQCLAANDISEIYGILNGTTNYILTRMVSTGADFDTALAEAQALGYAEANPTADISGADACRKICILASLAYGFHVYPDMVRIEGIENISAPDIAFGAAIGRKVKLLGCAKRLDSGKLYITVSPFFIPEKSPIACIDDVFNGIVVKGDAIDEVMFYGRGAGKYPTASAVVADVIDAAKHRYARKWMDWEESSENMIADCRQVSHDYLVRIEADNVEAELARAEKIFGSIETIKADNVGPCDGAFLVRNIAEKDILEKLSELGECYRHKMMLL